MERQFLRFLLIVPQQSQYLACCQPMGIGKIGGLVMKQASWCEPRLTCTIIKTAVFAPHMLTMGAYAVVTGVKLQPMVMPGG